MSGLFSIEELKRLITAEEDEHCEFKEAKYNYNSNDLTDYCVALSNEGGGYFILGVTNTKPRKIVGTQSFLNLEEIKHQLLQRIHIRVDAVQLGKGEERVVIFSIPPRPIGTPLEYKGRYLMRSGSSLEAMTPEHLKVILAENQPDFSAEICKGAKLEDLSPNAIKRLRDLWHRKTKNEELHKKNERELLADAELLNENAGITYAALVLLGTSKALGKYLPNSEVVYEYRNNPASIQYQQRREYRRGFLDFDLEIWHEINARNEVYQVQYGLFIEDVSAFNQDVVREGLLNAVCHRDYRRGESLLIRQYPKLLEIESPGKFPPGITADNIMDRQNPRNRRIAETFQKCGLVERSGQGADKMFRIMIEEGKPRPDYSGSDNYRVLLRLHSDIQDPQFLAFLDKVGKETYQSWSVHDLLVLDDIRQGKVTAADERIHRFLEQGVVEKAGTHGRGTRYILSKKFYKFLDQKGKYTRKIGLDRETNKALIISHLEKNEGRGSIKEFEQVLPDLTRDQIHTLLKELKSAGKVIFNGPKRQGYWSKKD